MKVFSIIVAVLYALYFILLFSLNMDNESNATYIYVMGLFVSALGFVLAIMGIANSKGKKSSKEINVELAELARLHELGVLTDDEFEAKKRQLMM